MGRRIKKARLVTGASIASARAAVLGFSAASVKPMRKDIRLARKVSASKVNKLLAIRGRKISKTIHLEEQAIAKILEDTAKQISKAQSNFRK